MQRQARSAATEQVNTQALLMPLLMPAYAMVLLMLLIDAITLPPCWLPLTCCRRASHVLLARCYT